MVEGSVRLKDVMAVADWVICLNYPMFTADKKH